VIRLRPPAPADAAAITAACQDPEIARWTQVPFPYRLHDALAWVAGQEQSRLRGASIELLVVGIEDDALLGAIGLVGLDRGDGSCEVGYWVARPARGRGVATRAVRLLSAWGLRELGLDRIELLVIEGNDASCRVAEAAGYRREGLLRRHREIKGTARDMVMYALRAEEAGPA
jgi:RimJ/RimL family protein N-acetyltransferase